MINIDPLRFGARFVVSFQDMDRQTKEPQIVKQIQDKFGRGLTSYQNHEIGVGYSPLSRFVQIDTGGEQESDAEEARQKSVDAEINEFLTQLQKNNPQLYFNHKPDGGYIDTYPGNPNSYEVDDDINPKQLHVFDRESGGLIGTYDKQLYYGICE